VKILKLSTTALLAVGLVACGNSISSSAKAIADNGGTAFSINAGGKFLGCSGEDSDGDGYVSCTMQPAVANGVTPPPVEILCGYKTAGCKLS
jgi:hypothetical protein